MWRTLRHGSFFLCCLLALCLMLGACIGPIESDDIVGQLEQSASQNGEAVVLAPDGFDWSAIPASLRDRLSEMLFDSSQLEDRRQDMLSEIAREEAELSSIADRLHDMRESAAAQFAEAMTESVRGLELPYAVFEVELLPVALSASGRDSVQFRVSATGRNAVDVAKCASGGEMSRIMLALKAMRARFANMPTMIFDEIDTGVSGSVADRMGSMICDMGSFMQVFAITHLPQVAAKGHAHYMVSKDVDPATGKAVSTIKKLSEDQRVLEVARMLSGSVLSPSSQV